MSSTIFSKLFGTHSLIPINLPCLPNNKKKILLVPNLDLFFPEMKLTTCMVNVTCVYETKNLMCYQQNCLVFR